MLVIGKEQWLENNFWARLKRTESTDEPSHLLSLLLKEQNQPPSILHFL